MFSLKFKNLKLKENWYRYVFLGLAVFFLAAFHIYGLAATIFLYIFLNIIFYLAGIRY
jgi:CDP-diacylglycerol---serine O-phosphatidyltransferase